MFSSVSSAPSPAQTKHVMLFIDGRNLARRYADMKSNGKKPKQAVIEINNAFVWASITFAYPWFIRGGRPAWTILRAYYYTYFTGSDAVIAEHKKKIKSLPAFQGSEAPKLTPIVFKKRKSDRDAKGDDVALSVEALHHSYNRSVDIVHIFTGDGSYVPLIEEIKHLGIIVFVSAFSSGLNPKIEESADVFFNLDKEFFEDTATTSS